MNQQVREKGDQKFRQCHSDHCMNELRVDKKKHRKKRGMMRKIDNQRWRRNITTSQMEISAIKCNHSWVEVFLKIKKVKRMSEKEKVKKALAYLLERKCRFELCSVIWCIISQQEALCTQSSGWFIIFLKVHIPSLNEKYRKLFIAIFLPPSLQVSN